MAIVGSAEIVVTALTDGVKSELQRAFKGIRPIAVNAGEEFGDAFGKAFSDKVNASMQKAFEGNRRWVEKEGATQGGLFAKTFVKALTEELQSGIADAIAGGMGDVDKLGEDAGKRLKAGVRKGAASGGNIDLGDVIGGAAPGAAAATPTNLPPASAAAAQRAADALQKIQTDAAARQQKLVDDLAKAEQARAQKAADNAQSLADKKAADDLRIAQRAIDNAQKLADAQLAQDQRLQQANIELAAKIANDNQAANAKRVRDQLAADQKLANAKTKFQLEEKNRDLKFQQEVAQAVQREKDRIAREDAKKARKALQDMEDLFDAAVKEDRKREAAKIKAARDAAQRILDEQKRADEEARKAAIRRLELAGRNILRMNLRIADQTRERLRAAAAVSTGDVEATNRRALQAAEELAAAELKLAEEKNRALSDMDRDRFIEEAEFAEKFRRDQANQATQDAQDAVNRAKAIADALSSATAQAAPTQEARGNVGKFSKAEIAEANRALKQLSDIAAQTAASMDAADRAAIDSKRELAAAIDRVTQAEVDYLEAAISGGDIEAAANERRYALLEQQAAQRRSDADAAIADFARVRDAAANVDLSSAVRRVDLFKDGQRAGRRFGDGLTGEFRQAALAANQAFTSMFAAGNVIGGALAGAVGGLSSLVSGFFALAAAASQAAGALVVIPSLIGAVAQAGATVGFAFSGVGKAISAGLAPPTGGGGGGGGGGATAAQQNAVADARKALARAYEDGARRMRDADRAVADAEENLVEAQNEAKLAQEALTGARRRAIESLEDLGFSVEGAALSEERAVLRLQQASRDLAEVQSNPSATAEDIQEASLSYREAELSVRMNKDALEDLQEEQAKATVAGVEGSAEVVDAQNDIIDANNRVADAEEALARAQEDRGDAMVQNARAISDAQERIARSMAAAGAAAGGAGGVDAFAAAMANLSPQAQKFVKFIISLKDEMKLLKDAAGEEMFPKLEEGIQNVVDNLFPPLQNVLRETGSAIGDFALSITDVIASSGFVERFTTIAEDNVTTIQRFGQIIASVIDGISGVLVAAGPLVDRFTSFLVDRSGDFQRFATSGEGIASMTGFFQEAGDAAAQIGRIFGNLFDSLMSIGRAAVPAGQILMDSLEGVTQAFADFNAGAVRQNELENFFLAAADNAKEVGGLFLDLGKILAGMGDNSAIGDAAKILREDFVPVLGRLIDIALDSSDALAKLAVSVVRILEAFADNGGMEMFFDTLAKIAELVGDFASSGFGQLIIGIVGPFVAITKAATVAYNALKFFFLAFAGGVIAMRGLTTSTGALGGAYSALITKLAGVRVAYQLTTATMIQSTAAAKATQAIAASMGGAANMGALASSVGGVQKAFIGMYGAVRVAASSLFALIGGPIGAVMLAVGGLIAVYSHFSNEAKKAAERNKAFQESLDATTKSATQETFDVFAESLNENVTDALDSAGVSTSRFFAAVAQGGPGLRALEAELRANGVAEEKISKIRGQVISQQDGYISNTLAAKNAAKDHGEVVAGAAGAFVDYSDAAFKATGIIQDQAFATGLAEDAVEQYADRLANLVQSFSNLNEEVVNSERSNLRMEEGFDKLKSQVEGFKFSLDATTEGGRAYKETILDQMEAINKYAQGQLDAGVAADVVNATYEKNKQALIDQLGPTEAARAKVEEYVAQIEKTPTEKQTQFTAILETAQVTKIVEQLDSVTLARLISMNPEVPIGSVEELNGRIAALAVAAGVANPIVLTPDLAASAINDVETKMAALVEKSGGNIDLLVEADKDAYDELVKQLTVLQGNPANDKPWSAIFIPEADRAAYKKISDRMTALTLGKDNNPRTVDFKTKEDEEEYKNLQEKLHAMLFNPDGSVRAVPYLADVNEDSLSAADFQLDQVADQERFAELTPTTQARLIQEQTDILNGLKYEKGTTTPRKADIATQALIKTAEEQLAAMRTAQGKIPVNVPVRIKVPDGQIRVGGPNGPLLNFRWSGEAEGGPIRGPGGPKSDTAGLFALSNGEFVLSAKAVQAMGGMSAATSLHNALKRGWSPPAMQTGGVVPATARGTLVRLGEAGQAERVEPLDVHGLSAADRAILAAIKDQNQGFAVNIGTIESPRPEASARQVVSAMRAESFRLGQLT